MTAALSGTPDLGKRTEPAVKTGRPRAPRLMVLVLLALITPLSFSIAGVVLSPSRVIFLIATPFIGARLIGGRYGGLQITDVMVFAYAFWMAISIGINNPDVMVSFAGSNGVEIVGGYLVARAAIRDADSFVGTMRFLGLLVLISIPFAVVETLTDRPLILEILNRLPFFGSNANSRDGQRMGLDRVQFVFSHPIHYGLWCSMIFGTVLIGMRGMVSPVRRILWAILSAFGTFLSLSSGPFLALMVQLFLIAYGFGMRRITQYGWRIFGIVSVVLYLLIEVLSDRPAYLAVITRLVMSPYTAYLRATLLEYGVAQIARTPVFGIGFYRDWGLPIWMSGSIDNYWLYVALTFGVPAFVFMFGAYLITMIRAGRRPFEANSLLWNLRFGWMVVTIGLMLTIATVAVWRELQTMIFLILGAGVWFTTVNVSQVSPERNMVPSESDRKQRYTRFGSDGHPFTREVEEEPVRDPSKVKKALSASRHRSTNFDHGIGDSHTIRRSRL